MKKLIWVILILLLAIPVGLFTYFTAQSYYQTRNMRNLAKQIEKTGWADYSYNIYSESVTSGYFKGEIWGSNGTYLNFGTIPLKNKLEDNYFDQINDLRVCVNGFVRFTDFVESQTGSEELKFKEALLLMDDAYNIYMTKLEKGMFPDLPRLSSDKNSEKCVSITEVKVPKRKPKAIRYP